VGGGGGGGGGGVWGVDLEVVCGARMCVCVRVLFRYKYDCSLCSLCIKKYTIYMRVSVLF